MSSIVRAKIVGGVKRWFVWSDINKEYPQCDGFSRSEFYAVLCEELGLPPTRRQEVTDLLTAMTWNSQEWIDDEDSSD